jgi:hypothetical protein
MHQLGFERGKEAFGHRRWPVSPAARISRATRCRPQRQPWATSSACTRGLPSARQLAACTARIAVLSTGRWGSADSAVGAPRPSTRCARPPGPGPSAPAATPIDGAECRRTSPAGLREERRGLFWEVPLLLEPPHLAPQAPHLLRRTEGPGGLLLRRRLELGLPGAPQIGPQVQLARTWLKVRPSSRARASAFRLNSSLNFRRGFPMPHLLAEQDSPP